MTRIRGYAVPIGEFGRTQLLSCFPHPSLLPSDRSHYLSTECSREACQIHRTSEYVARLTSVVMFEHASSERDRQATIARNREILAKLGLADAASAIKSTKQTKGAAKPVQPRVKKAREPAMPTRQSTRLRKAPIDPNESPAAKRKREVCELLFQFGLSTYPS